MSNLEQQLVETVRDAVSVRRKLRIRGSGSKDFYGQPWAQEVAVLDAGSHRGVVDYEPTELVVTVRSGTPLAELEALLHDNGQMLAFEPPHFASGATVGGMVAAGLSGPRRATAGAVRDYVLGARLLDGRGDALSFGGRVMKNVAGYDVSRALAGSLGTLGMILEVSLKTQPVPLAEATLRFELPESRAIEELNRWGGKPLPLSGSAWIDGELVVRLSGARAAVASAIEKMGGEKVDDAEARSLWLSIREQTHAFFAGAVRDALPLWRLSMPSITPAETLHQGIAGSSLLEWGGALRWFASATDAARVREIAQKAGGHATLFRGTDELRQSVGTFQPLQPAIARIHRNLKATFDPDGVFNPGRLYAGF
jgi:glycolate oxidase FAD binding subunit